MAAGSRRGGGLAAIDRAALGLLHNTNSPGAPVAATLARDAARAAPIPAVMRRVPAVGAAGQASAASYLRETRRALHLPSELAPGPGSVQEGWPSPPERPPPP